MTRTPRGLLLAAAAMAQLAGSTTAFVVPSPAVVSSVPQPMSTREHRMSSTELNLFNRRREIFQGFKKLLFTGAFVSTFERESAMAEEEPTKGRVVQLEIENLDGEPGKTGVVKIQLRPEWAPRGVQRFEDCMDAKFFDKCRIFRVIPGFIAQFGINGDPSVQSQWRSSSIPDDPVKVSNKRGTVVFATAGPNTRTTQIFINTRAQGNDFLDKQGFSPFGQIIEGMDIVDRFYAGYGEGAPAGNGPNQGLIQAKGNAYLEKSYPKLSYISKASFAD